jgi:hypothetical protein
LSRVGVMPRPAADTEWVFFAGALVECSERVSDLDRAAIGGELRPETVSFFICA